MLYPTSGYVEILNSSCLYLFTILCMNKLVVPLNYLYKTFSPLVRKSVPNKIKNINKLISHFFLKINFTPLKKLKILNEITFSHNAIFCYR